MPRFEVVTETSKPRAVEPMRWTSSCAVPALPGRRTTAPGVGDPTVLTLSATGFEPDCDDGGRSALAVPQAFGVEPSDTLIVVSRDSVPQSSHDFDGEVPLIETALMYSWPSD